MSPKKFWKLSFYEWSLYSLRIRDLANKRKFDHELMIRLARRIMFVNAKVMGSKRLKELDLWPLESDEKEPEGKEYTQEELDVKIEAIAKARNKKLNKKKK
jgi:hypothetical protein